MAGKAANGLTEGRPVRVILRFMLPVLIGNLFNLAYNLADIRIVGTFLGNDALAAVGSVSTFSELLLVFVIGLSNGFAVITAQTYGMGERERLRGIFAQSLLLGSGISLLVGAVTLLLLHPILQVLHVLGPHRQMAASYLGLLMAGLLFSSLYNTMAASLRAIGDAMTPLFFLMFSACLNVGLDVLLVGFLSMGVGGAAAATVLSQLVSALLCFLYAWKKYPYLRLCREDFRLRKQDAVKMLPSGFSMGIMNCLVSFGTVALQTAINGLGTNTIVAHTATRKLTSLFMLPHISIGTTMAAYVGQNYGAGRIERIRQGLAVAFCFCYAWCVMAAVIVYTACGPMIRAITDTHIQEVVVTAVRYQRVHILFYVVCTSISLLRNSLQGMGDHRTPIVSSTLELLTKVVFAFALTPLWGYMAIIWSEPVSWLLMVIPLILSMGKRLGRKVA